MSPLPGTPIKTEVHIFSYPQSWKEATLHKKMKFSINDFFSKCDQIRSFLLIWSHLRKKSVMKNFVFCAALGKLKELNNQGMEVQVKRAFKSYYFCHHIIKAMQKQTDPAWNLQVKKIESRHFYSYAPLVKLSSRLLSSPTGREILLVPPGRIFSKIGNYDHNILVLITVIPRRLYFAVKYDEYFFLLNSSKYSKLSNKHDSLTVAP